MGKKGKNEGKKDLAFVKVLRIFAKKFGRLSTLEAFYLFLEIM